MPMPPHDVATALAARTRRAVARRRSWWWVATMLLAAMAAWGVAASMRAAGAAADAWGSTVDVLVVVDDVPAGDAIGTRVRTFPSAMLPRDAVLADAGASGAGAARIARHP